MVRQVCFYVTKKCNLNCSYCAITKNLEGDDLSLKSIQEALQIIKDIVNPEFLVIFGGEPLFRKDIDKIIDKVNELDFDYTLITNGTINNEKTIKKLKGLTLSIDRLEQSNERGEASKSNWAMLKRYKGVVPDLVANITVTHTNVGELEGIVDKLNEMGIWIVFGLVHSKKYEGEQSTFRSYCPQEMLTIKDFAVFKKAFYKAKKRHNTSKYVPVIERHLGTMNWHCRLNPRNPEYMVILNNGSFAACSDYWGNIKAYSIFDLPTLGVESWKKICKADRKACKFACVYNHEVNLAYPEKNSLVHR